MAEAATGSRRGFLKLITVALSGLVGAVVAIPAIRFVIFPTRRKIVAGPDGMVPVALANAVGDKPLRVEITVPQQRDAWAKTENVRLGAAWLVRTGTEGAKIRAFTTTCPHLGCSVDYDPKADAFRCPCHKSAFDRSGERVSGPAKRGMDELETEVDADGRVTVRFRRFKLDVPEREES
jgi:Rieske Fe-S protein